MPLSATKQWVKQEGTNVLSMAIGSRYCSVPRRNSSMTKLFCWIEVKKEASKQPERGRSQRQVLACRAHIRWEALLFQEIGRAKPKKEVKEGTNLVRTDAKLQRRVEKVKGSFARSIVKQPQRGSCHQV